ncbi:hypothetical protein DPMN_160700 [Dreissena polymorpha]|uniref:Uncharacterized protein n=1 Tax=Dreissena polymorpha TaxID=45954 RepID=A0A9D4IQD7_DREPO|nr:hypothetical protein DPMN_160700 [Dreissena polymorpha]
MHVHTIIKGSLLSDSSSGYDSTDLSDAETDCSSNVSLSTGYRSASKQGGKTNANEGCQQVRARVSCTSTLCESLAMISSMPEMCDVIFKVGPEEVPVYGVRAILAIRSK